ncbi:MAG: carbamoyl-phosphate synthase large subunit [Saprospiraceae bacterium]|jgi:carbamoyl-phosphate synthase large subunit
MAISDDFIIELEAIISKEKIDILLIGTDTELPIISKNKVRLESAYNLRIVVAPEEAIHIADDKWLTAKFLRENNFPYPKSAMANDDDEVEQLLCQTEYPYLAKPIDGAPSRGLVIINTKEDLKEVCSYKNNLVIQELIPEEGGEYTSGCLVIKEKCVSVVTLRKDLRDGNTARTYRDKDSGRFDDIIADIAVQLKIEGPCNFKKKLEIMSR